ncbi:hypothetical protein Tco_0876850 [Tanacetum coccineum]|uniref:Uncharacterized protein n=1 Tax=Tanacetum coccineum TaxID=301880 RepID=A0ABQ5BZ89_9ASTR
MQKSLALIAKHFNNIYKPTNNNRRTSSNTRNKNVDTSPRTGNDRLTGQFRNQRTIIVTRNRETIGNQVFLYVKMHDEWLQDIDKEPDEQEQEAHYLYMEKIQEVLHVADDNSRPTYDVEP